MVWGCAAAPAEVLLGMRDHAEPGIFFDSLARSGVVGAIQLSSEYVDMGTRDALWGVEGA